MTSVADRPKEGLTQDLVWSPSGTMTIDPMPLRYTLDLGRGVRVEVSTGAPAWVYPVLARLYRLLELPANWDSYGARLVHTQAVVHTITFLVNVMRREIPIPTIVPTVEGNVQVEWHRNGVDLEIEVGRDGGYELSMEGPGESHEERGFVYDPGDSALNLHGRVA